MNTMRQVVTTPGGTYRGSGSSGPNPQGFGRGGNVLGFGSRLEPSAVSSGQQMLAQAGGSELHDVPFEMLVLEVLLDATAGDFTFLSHFFLSQ
jgi:hypothetical protein